MARVHIAIGAMAVLLLAAGAARAQPAEFQMTVTPKDGTQEDNFVVIVHIEIPGVSGPDRYWHPDFNDFRVLDRQTSQTTSMIFDPQAGQQLRTVEIKRYILQAKHTGRLVIGPARLRMRGKEYETRSALANVRESGVGSMPQGGFDSDTAGAVEVPGFQPPRPRDVPVFMHTAVDKNEVFLGEQLVITWLLYSRSDVLGFEPSPPTLADFWWESLYQPDKRLQYQDATIGGNPFLRAVVAKRALFPTKAGLLSIGPYSAKVTSIQSTGTKPEAVRSAQLQIRVKPLPPDPPEGFDPTYVGVFDVEASVDRNRVDAGESVTLTLTIRGEGAIRRLNPPVIAVDGIEVRGPREDDPRVDMTSNTVRGERVFRYWMKPQRGGALTVPAISIPYFDPGRGVYAKAAAAPITIVVAGDPTKVAEGSGRTGGSLRENLIGRDIRPSRSTSELSTRRSPYLYQSTWYWLLVAGPLLLDGLLVAGDRVRERLRAETPRSRMRRARGLARQRLRVAEIHLRGNRPAKFFGELASVLYGHLQEVVQEPVQSLTREQLTEFLSNKGFPGVLVDRLQNELEAFDFARFAPSAAGPGEMRAAMRRVRDLLRQIEKVRVDESAVEEVA